MPSSNNLLQRSGVPTPRTKSMLFALLTAARSVKQSTDAALSSRAAMHSVALRGLHIPTLDILVTASLCCFAPVLWQVCVAHHNIRESMDAKPQQLMPNALNSISIHQMKLASNPYP
jgi:hypothetical protein